MRQKIRAIPLGMPIVAFRFVWLFCVAFAIGLNVVARLGSFVSLKDWSQLTLLLIYLVVFLLLSVVYDCISRTWLLISDDTLRIYPTGVWRRATRYMLAGGITLYVETTQKVVLIIQCNYQRTILGPFAGKSDVVALRIKKCCMDLAHRFNWQLFVDGIPCNDDPSR
jgi:hypothetical protein